MSTALERRESALAVLFSSLVFLPSLYGQFVWDDGYLLHNNPNFWSPSRLATALTHDFWYLVSGANSLHVYYRPTTTLVYGLTALSLGDTPLPFRSVTLGFHALNAFLLYRIARRLSPALARDTIALSPRWQVSIPLLAVLWFATSPMRVESVAWASGLPDVLCLTCLMLVFLAVDALSNRRLPRLLAVVAVVLTSFVACLAKEPAYLALAAACVVLAMAKRWTDAGAVFVGTSFAVAARLLVLDTSTSALREGSLRRLLELCGWYAHLLVVPAPMSAFHGIGEPADSPSYPIHIALGCAALTTIAVVVFRAAPAWRRPSIATQCVGLSTVLLAPSVLLGVFSPTAIAVAERYLYLSSAALVPVVCVLLGRIPTRWRVAALLLIVGFGCITAFACTTYSSNETLFRTEVGRNSRNHIAQCEVAQIELDAGNPAAAMQHAATGIHVLNENPASHRRAYSRLVRIALAAETRLCSPEEIAELHRAYQSVVDGQPFEYSSSRVHMLVRASDLPEVMRAEEAFWLPRAWVAEATGHIPEADEAMNRLANERAPNTFRIAFAFFLARTQRYDLVAEQVVPVPAITRRNVILRIEQARQLTATDPISTATRFLALESPWMADKVLYEAGVSPADSVVLRIRSLLARGRLDEALASTLDAQQRFPQHRAELARAESTIRARIEDAEVQQSRRSTW